MPASKGSNSLLVKVAVSFLLWQVDTGRVKWISNACRDFSFNAGLNTLIVFQGVGLEILMEAYRALRENETARVARNRYTESIGHLLNYVLQSSVCFFLGGQGIRHDELRYRQLRKSSVLTQVIILNKPSIQSQSSGGPWG
jgi:hypothetical protein